MEKPADKKEKKPPQKKQLVPYHISQRGQWITAVKYHFWVLSVMDYRLLISQAGLKAAASLSLSWELPIEDFFIIYIHIFLKQKERERGSSPARLVTSSGLITSSAPPKWLSGRVTALHAYRSVTEGHNLREIGVFFWLCKHIWEAIDNLIMNLRW